MGDPRKTRKTYRRPSHPWRKTRIDEETALQKKYGLKNKNEIWKIVSELGRLAAQAKKLIREKNKGSKQADIEEKQLLDRLAKYGLINSGDSLDTVLSLESKDFLDIRLQTIAYKNGLALTPKQARQFIVHGHITVNGKKVTVPSYTVTNTDNISFSPISTIANVEHPERAKEKKRVDDAREAQKKKDAAESGEMTEEELEKIEKEIVAEVEV